MYMVMCERTSYIGARFEVFTAMKM